MSIERILARLENSLSAPGLDMGDWRVHLVRHQYSQGPGTVHEQTICSHRQEGLFPILTACSVAKPTGGSIPAVHLGHKEAAFISAACPRVLRELVRYVRRLQDLLRDTREELRQTDPAGARLRTISTLAALFERGWLTEQQCAEHLGVTVDGWRQYLDEVMA